MTCNNAGKTTGRAVKDSAIDR